MELITYALDAAEEKGIDLKLHHLSPDIVSKLFHDGDPAILRQVLASVLADIEQAFGM